MRRSRETDSENSRANTRRRNNRRREKEPPEPRCTEEMFYGIASQKPTDTSRCACEGVGVYACVYAWFVYVGGGEVWGETRRVAAAGERMW